MKKRIAVIIAGCGHQDGSEITEAVSTLLTLSEFGADFQCFSFNREFSVQNHVERKLDGGKRNMLVEAARIARGNVLPVEKLNPEDFDGLAIPGGNGMAIHFSTWLQKGAAGSLDPQLGAIIKKFHELSRPIAAICIAPVLVAKALGDRGVSLTTGNIAEVQEEVAKTGAEAIDCPVDDFVTDRLNKVITSPAYMYGDASPFSVYTGIRKAVKELVEMA